MRKWIFILTISFSLQAVAQKSEINWIGFEELDNALETEAKPVLIYFYTNWCVYCKKMDRHAFKDPEIVSEINKNYYAVKMDAETTEKIEFEGQVFSNPDSEHKRRAYHQIPQLIAARENGQMSFPAILVLDRQFRVKKKSFEYLTSEKMKELIAD